MEVVGFVEGVLYSRPVNVAGDYFVDEIGGLSDLALTCKLFDPPAAGWRTLIYNRHYLNPPRRILACPRDPHRRFGFADLVLERPNRVRFQRSAKHGTNADGTYAGHTGGRGDHPQAV